MMAGASRTAPQVLLALGVLATAAAAQQAEPTASVSADSVGIAEVFELTVRVPVPEGSTVYFQDTIAPTPDVESFGSVEWRAERADGGATLVLTYPLMPFSGGTVTVPSPRVVIVPGTEDEDGERIPGGSRVGEWVEAPRAIRYALTTPPQRVWVRPAHTSEDIVAGLSPRPPSDVLGFGWSWSSILLILLFASVIGGTVTTTTREWLANRPEPPAPAPPPPPTLDQARQQAVAELDRLLVEAARAGDHIPGLYDRASAVVRRYVERLYPQWGPDLTSTELMTRLQATAGADARLLEGMHAAERVKFGRLRPGTDAAVGHLQGLRAWLAGAGKAGKAAA